MKKMKFLGLCLCLMAPLTSLVAKDHHKYDYIIVGNGSAGAILARKLSDNHKKKVLVLEAGIDLSDDPKVLAANVEDFFAVSGDLTFDPRYSNTYVVQTAGNPVFKEGGSPVQIYSSGKGWGGSALHNGQVAVRGTPEIYDAWATISGNPAWSYNEMLPLMRALENTTLCSPSANLGQRGVGGPISISQYPAISPGDTFLDLFAAGTNAGYTPDYNDATAVSTTGHLNLGVSANQSFATAPNPPCSFHFGRRSFSANEFLPDSIISSDGKAHGNRLLHIQSNCYVSRVIFKGKKAKGVEFVFGKNGTRSSRAFGKTIILCAGPVESPAILQRSGIGDPALLNSLGIDVLVNNPNVGANLLNHYGFIAITNKPTTQIFAETFTNGSYSPALAAPYNYPNDNTRRMQFITFPIVTVGSSIYAIMLGPKSHGTIKIVSKNQFVYPDIDLGMYTDVPGLTPYTVNGSDANLAVATLNGIAQSVGGAANMIAPPPAAFASDADLFAYATSQAGLAVTYHIVGTTRMGTSIDNAVVDGQLNVFGIKKGTLMVADCGVLPILPDGNTCYAAYMVGLRAATILGVPVPPGL